MRKRFLIILIVFIVAILGTLAYLFFSPYSPLENIANSNQEGNETRTPWKFPNITFPWSPGKSSGGSGSGGSGSGGSGSSGSGSGSENVKPPIIRNNNTLFINSTHNLEVSVAYTINDFIFRETKSLPFSLSVQENTYVCLSETTGSGTIRWLMEDGSECSFSPCEGGLYNCNILMDRNYSITLRQYS